VFPNSLPSDLLTQLAHGLLCALTERLAFVWGIHKGAPDPDLLFGGGQHFGRVAVHNTCCAPSDRLLFRRQTVSSETVPGIGNQVILAQSGALPTAG
jgi:hypothetical protein